jgi:hypothetical protein
MTPRSEMRSTWVLCCWLAVLSVALLYVRYYVLPCRSPTMLQATLSRFRPDLLLEKQPIVLTDRVHDHADLLVTALRGQYTAAEAPRPVPLGVTRTTRSRLTMLFFHRGGAGCSSCAVDIVHPGGAGVRVLLPRHQTLLLPPHWRYTLVDAGGNESVDATDICLHDPVSWIACRLVFA